MPLLISMADTKLQDFSELIVCNELGPCSFIFYKSDFLIRFSDVVQRYDRLDTFP